MGFKVDDRVKVTKAFLLKLPRLVLKVKDGGIIKGIYTNEAFVQFDSGFACYIYFHSLKLKHVKNQQLLFSFMEDKD